MTVERVAVIMCSLDRKESFFSVSIDHRETLACIRSRLEANGAISICSVNKPWCECGRVHHCALDGGRILCSPPVARKIVADRASGCVRSMHQGGTSYAVVVCAERALECGIGLQVDT